MTPLVLMMITQDMMSGNILTDRVLPVPGLDYHDALLISRMARYVQRLDKQVNIHTLLYCGWYSGSVLLL